MSIAPTKAKLKPWKLYLDGKWQDARSGRTFTTINPATEEPLCECAAAGAEDVDLAVRAARQAFAEGPWPRMAAADRGAALLKVAQLIEKHRDEIAELETLNQGKPIGDSSRVDVPLTAACFRYYAGFADKLEGRTIPVRGPYLAYTLREPIGVIAAIVPWNYPLLLATYKVAPALAAGNAVILKPASQTPLTALRLGEIIEEAGLPPGIFQVITGSGRECGQAIVEHAGIDKIALTGSTETGRHVMQSAAKNLTKLELELGGKSPNIVFADADLEEAAKGATIGIFLNKGEICTAGSRLFVETKVKDQLLEKLVGRAKKLRQGDPLDPQTRLGPQVSKEHRESILRYVETGKKEGASLVLGGGVPPELPRGWFVQPTIFDGVANEMTIAQEEIFGPVLAVIPFESFDDVLRQANQSQFGLAAGVWTRDIKKAHRAARALQAGTVWVNTYNLFDPTAPYGGFKKSGFGRELGSAGIEEYTQLKSVWIDLS